MLSDIVLEDKKVEQATVLLRRAADADPDPQRKIALIAHLQQNAFPALALQELDALPPKLRESFQVSAIEARAKAGATMRPPSSVTPPAAQARLMSQNSSGGLCE